jgi:hypothetical protein
MTKQWDIRSAIGDDLEYIYSSWLNTLWKDGHHAMNFKRCVRKTVFFREYPKVIDEILKDPETKTAVACSLDDPKVVYGYAIAKPPTLHYCLVKETMHHFGIAKSLIEFLGLITEASHLTKKKLNLEYNPFQLYRKEK